MCPPRSSAVEPMLRPLIGEDTRLVLDLDPDAGRITIDPSQLDQILVNLALNARDAMTDGGTITIETGHTVLEGTSTLEPFDVTPGPYVCLAVSDTGVGMDRPTREHIFEPFFTTKAPGKGTGLGLATVYGIVRQAAGQVWLDSDVGLGTRFKVYFPKVDAPVGDGSAALPPLTPMRQASGRVLVVEDDLVVSEMTSSLLERAGYRVTAEPDGSSAIARWAASTQDPFIALVTDVIMPGMSGLELAERILATDPHAVIVLLSGYMPEALDADRLMGLGAIFLGKPITSRELVQAIQQARSRMPAVAEP